MQEGREMREANQRRKHNKIKKDMKAPQINKEAVVSFSYSLIKKKKGFH